MSRWAWAAEAHTFVQSLPQDNDRKVSPLPVFVRGTEPMTIRQRRLEFSESQTQAPALNDAAGRLALI